jgi:hypothetical protein
LLKIYTLPNHTITIGVCILETQLLGLLYGCGASFVQKWSMPWISEAAFLVCLRYDAGTILETMPKVGDDHRTAFSEKQ